MSVYNEKVMKTFANPQHVGVVENANAIGEVGSASCGDIMRITMLIKDGIVADAKFQTFGCAAAIATSSTAIEMVLGKTVEQAYNLTNKQVIEELGGLPPQKIHCSVLAEEAIKKAIDDYHSKTKKAK